MVHWEMMKWVVNFIVENKDKWENMKRNKKEDLMKENKRNEWEKKSKEDDIKQLQDDKEM